MQALAPCLVGTDEPFTLFKTKFAVSNRIFVKLGEISFSTYMLHQILIGWYLSRDPGLPWYVDAVILLAAAYLGSWAMSSGGRTR